jgi:hypothetical protein
LLINSVQTKCQNQETVVFYEVEKPKVQLYFLSEEEFKIEQFSNTNNKVEQQSERIVTDFPTFNSLLVHSEIFGTDTTNGGQNIIVSRLLDDIQMIWSKSKYEVLRGGAPKKIDERDAWDAQIDFLFANYMSLVESFLHANLRANNVVIELQVEGNTAFHYEKTRALAGIFADPRVETVCEIGFNAGHSMMNALLAREGIQVLSFDLGEHWDTYSKFSYQLFQKSFPNQTTIILGDSTKTVPQFIRERPDQKCNVIFVDGGHTHEIAAADIFNMAPLANRTFHRLIVDDTDNNDVRGAWEEAVSNGFVQETGMLHSNYCLAYDLDYILDETFDLLIPVLKPAENSGPLNPNDLDSTGSMTFGEYSF